MKRLISFDDRIFIAGASGMVGSSILRTLKNAGYGQSEHNGFIFAPSRKELDLSDYLDRSLQLTPFVLRQNNTHQNPHAPNKN